MTKKIKKIIGDRVYLRLLSLEDASDEYCEWLNNPEVNRYLETRKSTVPELKKYVQSKIDDKNSFLFGIFDNKNDRHVGNVKLEIIDGKAEFGMIIGNRNYWGRGIGTEATRLIIDYTFNDMGIDTIFLGVIPENKAAVKIYKKVGFKVTRIKKKAVNHNGVLYDQIIMSLHNLNKS